MNLKSVLVTGAAACALLTAGVAQADNYYLSVFGGWSSPDNEASVSSFTRRTAYVNLGIRQNYWTNISPVFGTNSGAFSSAIHAFPNPFVGYYATVTNSIIGTTQISALTDEFDSGFVVGAALGMDFQDGWRAELEATYRSFEIGQSVTLAVPQGYYSKSIFDQRITGNLYFYLDDSLATLTGSGSYTSGNPFTRTGTVTWTLYTTGVTVPAHTDGDITSFSLMANLWYDYQLGNSPFALTLGVGAGAAKLDVDYTARFTFPSNTQPFTTFAGSTLTLQSEADDWVFAWQLGAGLGYEIGNGMMLSAQYRYFSTGDLDAGGQDLSIDAHEGLIALNIPFGN